MACGVTLELTLSKNSHFCYNFIIIKGLEKKKAST